MEVEERPGLEIENASLLLPEAFNRTQFRKNVLQHFKRLVARVYHSESPLDGHDEENEHLRAPGTRAEGYRDANLLRPAGHRGILLPELIERNRRGLKRVAQGHAVATVGVRDSSASFHTQAR